jgi:polyhydroxybutyrate depolymerase
MGINLLILLLLVAALAVWVFRRPPRGGRRRIRVDGEWRSYTVEYPHERHGTADGPILLCFHGGLGRGDRLRRESGITEAALARGFTVVFPEAPGGWIDARPERGGSGRDLAFVDALLDTLCGAGHEERKVFAFGMSNGGMFAFRLAMESPRGLAGGRLAGMATLLAAMPVSAVTDGRSGARPVPIVLVAARDDGIVPWDGGQMGMGRRFGVGGTVTSAQATLDYWLRRNRAAGQPALGRLEDDAHRVEIVDFAAPADGAPVRFVSTLGWGHRWPHGGPPEFDICETILDFFAGLPDAPEGKAAAPLRVRLEEVAR